MKKMDFEVSRDKLLRENERESLIRQSRIDKEKVQDLKNKIHSINRRNEHKSQYEQMRHIQGHEDTTERQDEVDRLSEETVQLRLVS